MQGLQRADVEYPEGGEDSEENACAHGEEYGEGENSWVDSDGRGARDGECGVSGEAMNREVRESYAQNSSGDGEEKDFGECALEEMSR